MQDPICACGPACGKQRAANPNGGFYQSCSIACDRQDCKHAQNPLCSCFGCGKEALKQEAEKGGGFFQHCSMECASKKCKHQKKCACANCSAPAAYGFDHCSKHCAMKTCAHSSLRNSSQKAVVICQCGPSCGQPVQPGHSYCGRTCGQGRCGHAAKPCSCAPFCSATAVHGGACSPRCANQTCGHLPPPNTIWFYERSQPYYEFTNFFEDPKQKILIDGLEWPTSEHYYQASKFEDPVHFEQVRCLAGPRDAFDYAHKFAHLVRSDWKHVSVEVMRKAVRCKFAQSKKLQDVLLSTGSKTLVEHTKNDNFWGDGGDGSGRNELGQLLELIRSELQKR